jgi:hypothetical protein
VDEMWTDILRDPVWFDLNAQPHTHEDFRDTPSFLHKINYTVPGSLISTITLDIPETRLHRHQGRNVLLYMSGVHCTETRHICKCMSMIQVGDIDRYDVLPFDETVGIAPPRYATVTKREGYNGETGEFWSFDPEFHEIDRPASIVVTDLRKSLHNGVLHRSDGKAALTAGHIIARWFNHDEPFRHNGPSQIKLSGYKEFHVHGSLYNATYEKIEMYWGNRLAPTSVVGQVFPLQTQYFGDVQDAFVWAATNAA